MKEQYEFKTEGKNTGIVRTMTLDNGRVLSETLVAYSGQSLKAIKAKASGKADTLKEVEDKIKAPSKYQNKLSEIHALKAQHYGTKIND